MLPTPRIENAKFPEARKFEEQGAHRTLYHFSPNDDREIAKIWQGPHPDDGQPLEVVDGRPDAARVPDLREVPEEFAPGLEAGLLTELVAKLKALVPSS